MTLGTQILHSQYPSFVTEKENLRKVIHPFMHNPDIHPQRSDRFIGLKGIFLINQNGCIIIL